ncbi:MAG: hypothetical protein Q9183_004798, partial [Haloplaca sp. 2 TL-2023]
PEDQAILEAAYKVNPKPDRTVRAEIASKVSLGEKEISIWFQNKRQVSRRRSRPSTSHDILSNPPRSEGSDAVHNSSSFSIDPSSQDMTSSQDVTTPNTSQSLQESFDLSQKTDIGNQTTEGNVAAPTQEKTLSTLEDDTQQINSTLSSSSATQPTGSQPLPASALTSPLHDTLSLKSKPTKSTKKHHDNTFTLYEDPQDGTISPPSTQPGQPQSPHTKSLTPQLRLSTSLEGSACVKTASSPSPPRPTSAEHIRVPRAPHSLQRSQSAIVPPTYSILRPPPPIGRSRDSRTWEFYCDSDARDELTKQAEREQSGSAVGAIGLLRSKSKSSLSSGARKSNDIATGKTSDNKNKRDSTTVAKPNGTAKRLKADPKTVPITTKSGKPAKSKLARASSAVSRLENPLSEIMIFKNPHANQPLPPDEYSSSSEDEDAFIDYANGHGDKGDDEKKGKYGGSDWEDGNDGNESDKENWAPGTTVPVAARPRLVNRRTNGFGMGGRRGVLTESPISRTQSEAGMGAARARQKVSRRGVGSKSEIGKQVAPDVDDEVSSFMSGQSGVRRLDGGRIGGGLRNAGPPKMGKPLKPQTGATRSKPSTAPSLARSKTSTGVIHPDTTSAEANKENVAAQETAEGDEDLSVIQGLLSLSQGNWA